MAIEDAFATFLESRHAREKQGSVTQDPARADNSLRVLQSLNVRSPVPVATLLETSGLSITELAAALERLRAAELAVVSGSGREETAEITAAGRRLAT